jgi:hypothetical protein
MLFGRWTYERLRRARTDRTDDNPFTEVLHKLQKYVASTTLPRTAAVDELDTARGRRR